MAAIRQAIRFLSRFRGVWLSLLGLLLEAFKLALPVAVATVLFLAQRGDFGWWVLPPTVLALFTLLALIKVGVGHVEALRERSEYLGWDEAGALFYDAIPEDMRSAVRSGFASAEEAGWASLKEMILDGLVPVYGRWGEQTAIEKLTCPERFLAPVLNEWGNSPDRPPKAFYMRRSDVREATAIWLRAPK
ncbi:MAG: hypothetical protein JJU26_12830 [Oceanicaulis sp.]|nr:hypothetical protein [Oceanicaulis sp.]